MSTTTTITFAQIDDMARRLVETDVRYCVSALVAALAAREWDGSDGVDPDDLAKLGWAQPDADDYREAARDAGLFDAPIDARSARRMDVAKDRFGVWCFTTTDDDGDQDDQGTGYDGTEAGAWRAAFDSMGIDHPDGTECLEHWLVCDRLADDLEREGEAIARDVAGLTIWGRCTSGQAIYSDGVIQRIARRILEA